MRRWCGAWTRRRCGVRSTVTTFRPRAPRWFIPTCSRTWILLGGEHGHQVVLKVLSRSTPEPKYRSDATYFERIYGEALIDLSPEEVADSLRPRF